MITGTITLEYIDGTQQTKTINENLRGCGKVINKVFKRPTISGIDIRGKKITRAQYLKLTAFLNDAAAL